MFAAFSMSSMDIRMIKTLRRVSTPATPMENSAALNNIYQDKGTMGTSKIQESEYRSQQSGEIGQYVLRFSSDFWLLCCLLFVDVLLCQHDRAHQPHEQDDGRDLKGHHILLIQQHSQFLHTSASVLQGLFGLRWKGTAGDQDKNLAGDQRAEGDHPGPEPVCPGGGTLAVDVEEHDDEKIQDQDGARVHDELDGSQELGVQQDKDARDVEEQEQHEHHAVHGVPASNHEDRRRQDDRCKIQENKLV